MVNQFWNCSASISDRVITCLEPWVPPLASWQAVIVVHYSFQLLLMSIPTSLHLAQSPLYGTYYHYSGLGC